jgi:hypothetical protein
MKRSGVARCRLLAPTTSPRFVRQYLRESGSWIVGFVDMHIDFQAFLFGNIEGCLYGFHPRFPGRFGVGDRPDDIDIHFDSVPESGFISFLSIDPILWKRNDFDVDEFLEFSTQFDERANR